MKKNSVLSVGVGIFVAISSFFNFTETSHAKSMFEVDKISKETPVFLELANNIISNDGIVQAPEWHYSHQSHQSHYSHQSHQSHYSHYSYYPWS